MDTASYGGGGGNGVDDANESFLSDSMANGLRIGPVVGFSSFFVGSLFDVTGGIAISNGRCGDASCTVTHIKEEYSQCCL